MTITASLIIAWLLIGLLIGGLARLLVPGRQQLVAGGRGERRRIRRDAPSQRILIHWCDLPPLLLNRSGLRNERREKAVPQKAPRRRVG